MSITLKNAQKNYAELITQVFTTNTDEVAVVKTSVPALALKRVQYSVTADLTVELILEAINPANNKTILSLANSGEFVFDAMTQADMLKIDPAIFTGNFLISTHGAKSGMGYSIVLSCII